MILLNVLIDNHWGKVSNRRLFFDHIANKKGFDPLKAENWYSISSDDI